MAVASAVTQMNTRIDRATKERGDRAFGLAGYTPSQVVRLVWGFAARNEGSPHAVGKFLDQMQDSSDCAEGVSAQGNPVHEGWEIIDMACALLGVGAAGDALAATAVDALGTDPLAATAAADAHADLADTHANAEFYYDDLREQACLDSLRERGYL